MTPSAFQPPRRDLFGLSFVDHRSVDLLADHLAQYQPRPFCDRSQLPVVVTPNVDQVVHRHRVTSPTANRLADAAEWVLPDGQPIVWASRLLGAPLTARLPGSSLVARLWPRLIAERRSTLVVASSEDLASRVRAESGTSCAVVAPMLTTEAPEDTKRFGAFCADLLIEHRTSHVFVTLGFPKQDLLISEMFEHLRDREAPLPLALGVGQSFDMYYGLVRRAPAWMQRSGLEWFYRFLQEPRRLFRRYFIDDPAFAALVWREWRARHRAGSRSS